MSRAYRISVSESLRRHVKVDDGIKTQIELLEILPRERMAELLAAELAKLGFEREGGVARRVDEDGMEVVVTLETGEVLVRQSAETDLELSGSASATSARQNDAAAEEKLREKVQRDLEAKAEAARERLRAQLSDKLEGKLRDVRQALDRAAGRATAEALKQKAASLGEIEEVAEDEEAGSLTIRVRL